MVAWRKSCRASETLLVWIGAEMLDECVLKKKKGQENKQARGRVMDLDKIRATRFHFYIKYILCHPAVLFSPCVRNFFHGFSWSVVVILSFNGMVSALLESMALMFCRLFSTLLHSIDLYAKTNNLPQATYYPSYLNLPHHHLIVVIIVIIIIIILAFIFEFHDKVARDINTANTHYTRLLLLLYQRQAPRGKKVLFQLSLICFGALFFFFFVGGSILQSLPLLWVCASLHTSL
ncbi:hypothetical protein K505DRAFT_69334 [Melanomma pulvis-pyrius CBS 109.77]|uniref:Uncharacterized protein n=1 Tax=Melanomma pulvis-pyrius CBS 109.77 TaxID=1314802 RepID=A0A6A6X5F3_9PLEO|nr:hypothetical protein K505DRAFT_69334 [Melanomma pulvis-pyrius CBS 109.77]